MRELDRIIGVLGTIGLVLLVAGTSKGPDVLGAERVVETMTDFEVAEIEVTEEKEIVYLSADDFAELYKLRPEAREENSSIVELSYNDALLLMKVTAAEAGDDLEGEKWTMRVILNRLEDGNFGSSISEIVSAPGQFEVYSSGRYKTTDIYVSTHLALAEIEEGWDESQGALYFEASSNSDHSWHKENRIFIAEISGQRYYR